MREAKGRDDLQQGSPVRTEVVIFCLRPWILNLESCNWCEKCRADGVMSLSFFHFLRRAPRPAWWWSLPIQRRSEGSGGCSRWPLSWESSVPWPCTWGLTMPTHRPWVAHSDSQTQFLSDTFSLWSQGHITGCERLLFYMTLLKWMKNKNPRSESVQSFLHPSAEASVFTLVTFYMCDEVITLCDTRRKTWWQHAAALGEQRSRLISVRETNIKPFSRDCTDSRDVKHLNILKEMTSQ